MPKGGAGALKGILDLIDTASTTTRTGGDLHGRGEYKFDNLSDLVIFNNIVAGRDHAGRPIQAGYDYNNQPDPEYNASRQATLFTLINGYNSRGEKYDTLDISYRRANEIYRARGKERRARIKQARAEKRKARQDAKNFNKIQRQKEKLFKHIINEEMPRGRKRTGSTSTSSDGAKRAREYTYGALRNINRNRANRRKANAGQSNTAGTPAGTSNNAGVSNPPRPAPPTPAASAGARARAQASGNTGGTASEAAEPPKTRTQKVQGAAKSVGKAVGKEALGIAQKELQHQLLGTTGSSNGGGGHTTEQQQEEEDDATIENYLIAEGTAAAEQLVGSPAVIDSDEESDEEQDPPTPPPQRPFNAPQPAMGDVDEDEIEAGDMVIAPYSTGGAGGGGGGVGAKPGTFLPCRGAAKIMPAIKYKSNTVTKATRNSYMAFGTFGRTTQEVNAGTTFEEAGNIQRDKTWGNWALWMGDVNAGLRNYLQQCHPTFSSRQSRIWKLGGVSDVPNDSLSLGTTKWAFHSSMGTVHKTWALANSQEAPGISWGKMRVGNFKVVLLPYCNTVTESTQAPALVPKPRMHLAWKYLTKNKYTLNTYGTPEDGNCIERSAVWDRNTRRAIVQPLQSEAAAKHVDLGEGIQEIPLQIEYRRKFSVENSANDFEEWQKSDWTPWFSSEATLDVRTVPIMTQLMVYAATLAPGLVNRGADNALKGCHMLPKTPMDNEWLAAYRNLVINFPARFEYDIQFAERQEKEYM